MGIVKEGEKKKKNVNKQRRHQRKSRETGNRLLSLCVQHVVGHPWPLP